MKSRSIHIFFIILIYSQSNIYAQKLGEFSPLRYNDDYSFLKDSVRGDYEKIKFTPLSKNGNSYISFGGEVRFQYFFIKNELWGDVLPDKDDYVMARSLFHTDIHAGQRFRAFVQLQSSLVNSKPATSPVDENPLDLHQAFIDVIPLITGKNKLTFRLGRQEFLYGSQRLVSAREGPNNRQAFDAANVIFNSPKNKTEIFYSHPVASKKGIFDDNINKTAKLWGAYSTQTEVPVIKNIDLYYLGLWKETARVNDAAGRELRHTVGTRIFRNLSNWKYDIEGIYQFGDFAGKKISAWTASLYTTYKFSEIKLQPEIGFKTELISGDLKKDDDKVQTFNALYPRGAYFGLAALIGPSNLTDIHPTINLTFTKKLSMTVDYDLFWRFSKNDGLYEVNMSPMFDNGSDKKRIGSQLATYLFFNPNDYIAFQGELTWFKAGPYLKDVSAGKDILFTGLTVQVKF